MARTASPTSTRKARGAAATGKAAGEAARKAAAGRTTARKTAKAAAGKAAKTAARKATRSPARTTGATAARGSAARKGSARKAATTRSATRKAATRKATATTRTPARKRSSTGTTAAAGSAARKAASPRAAAPAIRRAPPPGRVPGARKAGDGAGRRRGRTQLADEHPMASNITPEQALENTRHLLEQRAGASRTPPGLQPSRPPAEAGPELHPPGQGGRDGERLRGFPALPRNAPGRGGRHH